MKSKSKDSVKEKTVLNSKPDYISNIFNIIILFLFTVFIFAITSTKISQDNDVFWHLATGRYIIENKTIPSADVFGFVTEGTKWIPFEWGWDVINYVLFLSGSWILVSVFKSIIIILIFFTAYRLCIKLKIPVPLLVLISLFLSFGMLTRFGLRPYIISYLFVTIVLFILINFRLSSANPKSLYFLPVIFLVWANMHMGVLLGFGIFFIFIISEGTLFFLREKNNKAGNNILTAADLKKIILIFLLCIAGMLLNPFFINTYIYTYSHTQMDTLENINEWRSPFDSALAGFYYVKIYIGFLIAGLTVLYYSFRKKDLFSAMLFIGFGIYSMFTLRYTSDFMIIIFIPLLIAANFILSYFRKNKTSHFSSAAIISGIVLTAVLIYLNIISWNDSLYKDILNNRFRETGFGVNEKFYPVEMFDFIKRENINNIGSRPFNSLRLGGYFSWNFPESKNFIDSRNLNSSIMAEYNIIDKRKAGFEDKLKSYNIDYIIYSIPYLTENAIEIKQDLLGYLSKSPDWKLIFWDDKSFLYVKNDVKFKAIIDKYEYKYVTPENFIYKRKVMYNALQSDKEIFMKELRRKAAEDKNGILTNSIIREMNIGGL